MTKPDLMHLACKVCGWVIPNDLTLGVIEEHFATEHPEHVKDDGRPSIDFEMVACCTKCNDKMPLFATFDRGDHWEHHYNCERCHRTYRIDQSKDDPASNAGRRLPMSDQGTAAEYVPPDKRRPASTSILPAWGHHA